MPAAFNNGAPPMNGNLMQQPQPAAANNNYNPDYFEYDDELPEGQIGERVVLSNEAVPREIGIIRTIGTRKEEDDFCFEWEDEQDEDDARIEAFLSSHKHPSSFMP